ncbi:uncharacterized protein LOC143576398 [Bidens hawaiensis]|uniref:uncharacterized protein LOC143576398 n=1 Tax=Bidens hawaiensis TaxID=980011 RepID=UPI004049BC04
MTDYTSSSSSLLISSFRRIPPSAIPATLDCILASSNPSSLFSLLLPFLSQQLTTGAEEESCLDDEQSNFISSYVAALSHLLKKPGLHFQDLQDFVSRVLIPLMKMTHNHNREIADNAMASFLDVVMETNAWTAVEETMVPYFIKSVALTMGTHENKQPQIPALTTFGSFPLFMACHILASILDASVKGKHDLESTSGPVLANGYDLHAFTGNLISDICNVTLQMLSHSPEHRSCAITIFLPRLFESVYSAFQISVRGGGDLSYSGIIIIHTILYYKMI